MKHDADRHHRRSICLKGYDYSEAGAYFITICANSRECLFGDVVGEEMRLKDAGQMVRDIWHRIPEHFPHADIDEFIVMPNHVHGIIVINPTGRGMACHAPTHRQFAKPITGSLSTIVGSFKSAITRQINLIRNTPGCSVWQRNYYEHVIRSEEEMNRIREYIIENPVKWSEDENHPANIIRGGAPMRYCRGMACHAPAYNAMSTNIP
jgi:REP element-mobilizing transposase RayT